MELLSYVNNLSNVYKNWPETLGRLRRIMRDSYPIPLEKHQDMIINAVKSRYYMGMRFTDWQLIETVLIFIKVRDENIQ